MDKKRGSGKRGEGIEGQGEKTHTMKKNIPNDYVSQISKCSTACVANLNLKEVKWFHLVAIEV